MRRRDTVFVGFMLFALFFGAGNLIYPPSLGISAGTAYWPAIAGFVLTGVGLPILTVAAISLVGNGAVELGQRVHPWFGVIFTSIVYLAIGPFFGIPRAANVAYEMGVSPLITTPSSQWLLLFSIAFFSLVFIVSLNASKLVDRIGQWLTPALLLTIIALVIGSLWGLKGEPASPSSAYQTQPFFTGFIEGYLTMDAIAALAFGIIVMTAFHEKGVQSRRRVMLRTLQAGGVTAIGLSTVYASIGWIGSRMADKGTFTNGGEILSGAANLIYGSTGALLLGVLVALACLTTCIGLTVACGQFFSSQFPVLSYKAVISIVTLLSLTITNVGLNQIIAFSVPVLVFIYPVAIVLVLLTFIHPVFQGSPYVYRGALLFTAAMSLYDGLTAFGLDLAAVHSYLSILPLFEQGLGWLIPALAGGLIGWVWHLIKIRQNGHIALDS
ncbi:branched-chain amino acid transport system II carrier protein [Thalassobacillus sp. CUG 92003]|uniref:branched-chain amino acid transport system II carrier protein n=1 Tax=Thalassobacillus sp. CUG 92003 TaxID=2736641 RepID=UPI0015E67B5F|nr:branched-chain amino acid transport system II carrier protein [Thalassobacillus sp. CUG 92003]